MVKTMLIRLGLLLVGFVTVGPCSLAAGAQSCPGDCDGMGRVTAGELTRMVAIVLDCNGVPAGCGAVPGGCTNGDNDGNGQIDVSDILTVVNNVLGYDTGCPPPSSPTAVPTATATAIPASATATSLPPTHTPTSSPTASFTATPTDSPPPTATATQVATATVAVPTATATATATTTPTVGAAICGNSSVEAGETCDDGNTVTNPPQDTCPGDCKITTCSPAGTQQLVAVNFASAVGLTSVVVVVEYTDGVVQIPSTAADTTTVARVTNRPSGFLADIYDFDYALRVSLAGTRAISGAQLFRINLDRCQDASAPQTSNFVCKVKEANDTQFKPVTGVTCSVALL